MSYPLPLSLSRLGPMDSNAGEKVCRCKIHDAFTGTWAWGLLVFSCWIARKVGVRGLNRVTSWARWIPAQLQCGFAATDLLSFAMQSFYPTDLFFLSSFPSGCIWQRESQVGEQQLFDIDEQRPASCVKTREHFLSSITSGSYRRIETWVSRVSTWCYLEKVDAFWILHQVGFFLDDDVVWTFETTYTRNL